MPPSNPPVGTQNPPAQVFPAGQSPAAQRRTPVQLALGVQAAVMPPACPDRQQMSPPWQFAVCRHSRAEPVQEPAAPHVGPLAPPRQQTCVLAVHCVVPHGIVRRCPRRERRLPRPSTRRRRCPRFRRLPRPRPRRPRASSPRRLRRLQALRRRSPHRRSRRRWARDRRHRRPGGPRRRRPSRLRPPPQTVPGLRSPCRRGSRRRAE
jgi:hypothetical protein